MEYNRTGNYDGIFSSMSGASSLPFPWLYAAEVSPSRVAVTCEKTAKVYGGGEPNVYGDYKIKTSHHVLRNNHSAING